VREHKFCNRFEKIFPIYSSFLHDVITNGMNLWIYCFLQAFTEALDRLRTENSVGMIRVHVVCS
jgi:hypothetical protein